MAKRRAAEPLTFHVPWKRPLVCNFPEEPPPLWIPRAAESHPGQHLGVPELPRKRKIDAGAMTEPSGSPSKRHDCGETNARDSVEREGSGLETGEPSLLQQPPLRPNGPGEEPGGARPPRGGGDDGAGRAESPRGDWGASSRQTHIHQDALKGEKLGSLLQERTLTSKQRSRGLRANPWQRLERVRWTESTSINQGNRPRLNEEFWQYNTFQYWRNPLPPIDLADIEDVNADNLTGARLRDKDEVVEIDMES